MEVVGASADSVCTTPCFNLMPLLLQSSIRCCHSCRETLLLISVIAVVMLVMIKLLFVVFDLLCQSVLNSVQMFNLLGQSVLYTVIWSLVYHFFWTHSRHGFF